MNTTINAVKFRADEKLVQYINEKINKLDRMIDNAIGCEVTLKVDKPESDNNKIVDIRIARPGQDLFISKQADSFEQAISEGIDAIKPQLEKLKDRQ